MRPDARESRPAGGTTEPAQSISTAIKAAGISVPPTVDDTEQAARCVACGHAITSAESLRTGMGQECRRRLRRALRDADPQARADVYAALGSLSGVVA